MRSSLHVSWAFVDDAVNQHQAFSEARDAVLFGNNDAAELVFNYCVDWFSSEQRLRALLDLTEDSSPSLFWSCLAQV